MPNVWNEAKQQWVDTDTGNTYVNGVWVNPQGQQYVNGQWVGQGSGYGGMGQTSGSGYGATSSGAGSYGVVPGYQWYVDQINRDHETAMANLNNSFAMQRQQQDAGLQQQLQQGRITSDQYMQSRDLAQRESEFARNLAVTQLQNDRDYKLQQANQQINAAAEMRNERQLQANLASNPQDFVAYEFYKRMLGKPGAWDTAQAFANGQGGDPTAANIGNGTADYNPSKLTNLNGDPYAAPPPAYSDASLQSVLSGLFGKQGTSGTPATGSMDTAATPDATGNNGGGTNGAGALYNPDLSGQGVFGSTILGPNAISRKQGLSLSDSEMGILSSFLKGGVTDSATGGKVAIDPQDYFKQMQNSWIPAFSDSSNWSSSFGRTQYK